ncbi:hypothetical protein FHS14_001356 [Paenibacillus baekrokdamisoli]|nr:hypothetical protein [Paenibacillus baekrokdamisoli]
MLKLRIATFHTVSQVSLTIAVQSAPRAEQRTGNKLALIGPLGSISRLL